MGTGAAPVGQSNLTSIHQHVEGVTFGYTFPFFAALDWEPYNGGLLERITQEAVFYRSKQWVLGKLGVFFLLLCRLPAQSQASGLSDKWIEMTTFVLPCCTPLPGNCSEILCLGFSISVELWWPSTDRFCFFLGGWVVASATAVGAFLFLLFLWLSASL